MEDFNIYKNIAERTQGDIYVGVVGPVRTGKSTFIKRFMDMMVIPKIENDYKKERAKDELPQSGSGKSIHTTEPKFIPNEAVEIILEDGIKFKVRMVDCVGYIVKGALGYTEGENAKMVTTPWYDYEIPFEEAAEIGTKKVITDHSTIGLVVITDGSITDIPREEYIEAEERVIDELKSINKPFMLVLNSAHGYSKETKQLKKDLEEKYDVPVQIMDVLNMNEEDVMNLFQKILKEFPIKEINIELPEWIEKLEPSHWLKEEFLNIIKEMCKKVYKVRDIKKVLDEFKDEEFMGSTNINEMNMGEGTAVVEMRPKQGIFYQILSEICDCSIRGENELLSIIQDLHVAKVEYDKISDALKEVRETGYGLVAPELSEMKFEKPEREGDRIKFKASAPSLHFIKADIETEIRPSIGVGKETEDYFNGLLEQFDSDPAKLWQSNMFGKPLEVMVKEGLQNKLYRMPEDVQIKIQRTLQKIINEGNGGLICIIL